MPVLFHTAEVRFKLPHKKEYKTFLQNQVRQADDTKLRLNYVFCNDAFLLNINQQFLNHDTYTDIITFPLSESEKEIEAEIYISLERIGENANKHKVTFEEELQRVMFHGVLHLLGFKDKSAEDKKKMRSLENQWIEAFHKFLRSQKLL